MRTGNPALNSKAFEGFSVYDQAQTMTVQGTALKTGILLALVVAPAAFTWNKFLADPSAAAPFIFGGAIGGLVLALVTVFKKTWSPVTAPLYAVAQGLFLGGISAMYNTKFQGVPFQAACLTFGTLFSLLTAYQTGWIRATENFKLGVAAATGGIFLVYMAAMVMRLFGMQMPFLFENGIVGIGISLFIVVIAALNLVLDFDFIEQGAAHGAPKYMEWYGAFGLMVTLIWLYVELLRLLAKINSRD